jgi:hypothetical protein
VIRTLESDVQDIRKWCLPIFYRAVPSKKATCSNGAKDFKNIITTSNGNVKKIRDLGLTVRIMMTALRTTTPRTGTPRTEAKAKSKDRNQGARPGSSP